MKDQLKRTIQIKKPLKRIVSLVPSQTELLVDLGLKEALVGITKFCVHPSDLRKVKTVVGGTKQVHFDKIKALQPDIILCNKEENTKEMIAELEQIAPVHISDIYTIDNSLELTAMYGELFDKEEESNQLVQAVQAKHNDFNNFVKRQNKLRVAYFIWKNPWMVAAKQNFIDEMLQVNNLENVFQDRIRYPEIQLKELQDLKPELILLSSEPFPFKLTDVKEFESEFPDAKIKIVDGEAFSWYGSRLLKAFDYFKELRMSL